MNERPVPRSGQAPLNVRDWVPADAKLPVGSRPVADTRSVADAALVETAESIRRAHLAEKPELEALQMRASLMWEEDREMLIRHPEAVSIPADQFTSGMVLVAEGDEQLSGFAALALRSDGEIELDGLFVEPCLWKQGVATCLMAAAEALAFSTGSRRVHVIANPRAQAFYAKCGYRIVGTTELTWRAAVLMEKWLPE